MAIETIPVYAVTLFASGQTVYFGELSFKTREVATLTNTSPPIVRSDRNQVVVNALNYSFAQDQSLVLDPIPATVALNGGYDATLSLDTEGVTGAVYYNNYYYNLANSPSGRVNVFTGLAGIVVTTVYGHLEKTRVVFEANSGRGSSPTPIQSGDQFRPKPTTIPTKFLMKLGSGEVREYVATLESGSSGGGPYQYLSIPSEEAKLFPKSNKPVAFRFRCPSGLLSPWVEVRFAPYADVVLIDMPPTDDTFQVDTSGSYDIDDGIVTRQFFLRNGSALIDVSSLAIADANNPELFSFSWEAIADLTGLEFSPSASVVFDFVVTDVGGLADTATFTVTPPTTGRALQLGAVQFPGGRLLYAAQDGKDIKIRGGQLVENGTKIKLQVLGTLTNCSCPSLALQRDKATVRRSYRTETGAVLLDESSDGGKTWH